MTTARYQHNLWLNQQLEDAWREKQRQEPGIKFNEYVRQLLQEDLCVTGAPSSTIRSAT